ncbi:hypothetical protein [Spirillospora sp. CA-294931]|uniref:hypothetical protein n=1 Tax=Spirillospora sp. CA-294931 TaxID=3240042 RepID=UPI003D924843
MRHGVTRVAGLVLVLCGTSLLSGCGGGDNTGTVCADAKKAYEQYITQVRGVSAAKPDQWKQPTEQLAGRVDGLSAKADDKTLKKVLKDEAGRLRAAATTVATGDTAQLNGVISATPEKLGKACD